MLLLAACAGGGPEPGPGSALAAPARPAVTLALGDLVALVRIQIG